MTNEFIRYFEEYTRKIKSRIPMAMYRFADGELMLIDGKTVGPQTQASRIDRWQAPEGKSLLGIDLKLILNDQGPSIHFGIPCICCDPIGNKRMQSLINKSPKFPVNLFINGNYSRYKDFIASLSDLPIALWVNHRASVNHLPFRPIAVRQVPDDCVHRYQSEREYLLNEARQFANSMSNTIFFIAAGPLSESLIHVMWNQNPNNTYVDVGSSLDEYVYMKKTRPYHDLNHPYASQMCQI